MPLEAPRVQGRTLKRPFEESVRHGRKPKQATKGGLKSIKSEAPMGFDFNDFISGEGRIKGISPWKKILQEIFWFKTEP